MRARDVGEPIDEDRAHLEVELAGGHQRPLWRRVGAAALGAQRPREVQREERAAQGGPAGRARANEGEELRLRRRGLREALCAAERPLLRQEELLVKQLILDEVDEYREARPLRPDEVAPILRDAAIHVEDVVLVERSQGLLSMNAIRVVEVLPQLNLALADQGVKPCGSAREGAAAHDAAPRRPLPTHRRLGAGKVAIKAAGWRE